MNSLKPFNFPHLFGSHIISQKDHPATTPLNGRQLPLPHYQTIHPNHPLLLHSSSTLHKLRSYDEFSLCTRNIPSLIMYFKKISSQHCRGFGNFVLNLFIEISVLRYFSVISSWVVRLKLPY